MTERRPDPLAIGTTVDGKYVVTTLIRQGGMGAVYEARHCLLGRRVAIKVIQGRLRSHSMFEKQFVAEGRMVASLANPHVVQVFDFGMHEGSAYMVMELLE